ncbi:hypothetical protein MZM54_00030 [[Brevibacterium] frigoritolerans]|nr:hypothetical protein [Peribacillus frigoritolerans]
MNFREQTEKRIFSRIAARAFKMDPMPESVYRNEPPVPRMINTRFGVSDTYYPDDVQMAAAENPESSLFIKRNRGRAEPK